MMLSRCLSTRTAALAAATGPRAFSTMTSSLGGTNPTKNLSTAAMHKEEDHPVGVYDKIAFIGAGKMAEALISPLVNTAVQPPNGITIYDVSNATMERLSDEYSVQKSESIPDCISDADLIVCAIKPQNCDKVFGEIQRARTMGGESTSGITIREDATLLSIIAGYPISRFIEGTGITKVARSMPNTPAMIGQGMTTWTCTPNIGAEERDKIEKILSTFGESIFVEDETFIDMSTSISGSGPAYIFMLMEAMIDAGVHMGLPRETATKLTYHTLLGSTLYAMQTGENPTILRNKVTSPADTTASAIYELENGKFRTVIKDAIWACFRRSLEMGGHDSNVGPGRTPFVGDSHHLHGNGNGNGNGKGRH